MTEQIAIGAGIDPGPEPEGLAAAPEPARRNVAELADGEAVNGVFAVRDRDLAKTRQGKPYLRFKLADASGTVAAVCWEDAPECFEVAVPGTVVRVRGRFALS